MIENKFSLPIQRSKWLLFYLIVIHTLILFMLVSLSPNVVAILMSTLVLGISFIWYCRQYQWLQGGSNKATVKVERNIRSKWQIQYSDGSVRRQLDLKHCLVTPKLVILYFPTKSVTLVADAVDTELFRQLRVYLRDPKIFQK